jgi:hypothetical protein
LHRANSLLPEVCEEESRDASGGESCVSWSLEAQTQVSLAEEAVELALARFGMRESAKNREGKLYRAVGLFLLMPEEERGRDLPRGGLAQDCHGLFILLM